MQTSIKALKCQWNERSTDTLSLHALQSFLRCFRLNISQRFPQYIEDTRLAPNKIDLQHLCTWALDLSLSRPARIPLKPESETSERGTPAKFCGCRIYLQSLGILSLSLKWNKKRQDTSHRKSLSAQLEPNLLLKVKGPKPPVRSSGLLPSVTRGEEGRLARCYKPE